MPTLLTDKHEIPFAVFGSHRLAEYVFNHLCIAQPDPSGADGLLGEIPPPPYFLRVVSSDELQPIVAERWCGESPWLTNGEFDG